MILISLNLIVIPTLLTAWVYCFGLHLSVRTFGHYLLLHFKHTNIETLTHGSYEHMCDGDGDGILI